MAELVREVFVGLGWGDEGKGKIVDQRTLYAFSLNDNKRVVVIRYQGGANAGHSVYLRDIDGNLIRFVTHASPSGLTNGADIAIGPQVAFNPLLFSGEVKEARERFNYNGRIMISERTGILFEYHKKIDEKRESSIYSGIGSTKQGIAPFYEDNARRVTRITARDYVSDKLPDRLGEVLELKRGDLEEAGIQVDDYLGKLLEDHRSAREELRDCVGRLEYRINEYLDGGHHIIGESSQGSMLDVDMGTIPHQTSSHLLASHFFPSLMLPRSKFKVIGIEKAYPTRVGDGDMPTLAKDEFGERVAGNAGEFGATTGRRRRVGYPDWVISKRSAMLNDCDGIYIMRADNLQDEDVKVCVAYEYDGERTEEVPLYLGNVKPIYSSRIYRWKLWEGHRDLSKPMEVDEALRGFRQRYVEGGLESLPGDLRDFVRDYKKYVGREVVGISIGPGRGETVLI